MSSTERALLAIRSQARFELVDAAAEVVQAAKASAHASERVTRLQSRCESFMRQLRELVARPRVNVPLVDAMRRRCRIEQIALHEWRSRRADAERRESNARAILADARNRERSLDRAVQAEQRKRGLRLQALDADRVDELWLQHSLRGE